MYPTQPGHWTQSTRPRAAGGNTRPTGVRTNSERGARVPGARVARPPGAACAPGGRVERSSRDARASGACVGGVESRCTGIGSVCRRGRIAMHEHRERVSASRIAMHGHRERVSARSHRDARAPIARVGEVGSRCTSTDSACRRGRVAMHGHREPVHRTRHDPHEPKEPMPGGRHGSHEPKEPMRRARPGSHEHREPMRRGRHGPHRPREPLRAGRLGRHGQGRAAPSW